MSRLIVTVSLPDDRLSPDDQADLANAIVDEAADRVAGALNEDYTDGQGRVRFDWTDDA